MASSLRQRRVYLLLLLLLLVVMYAPRFLLAELATDLAWPPSSRQTLQPKLASAPLIRMRGGVMDARGCGGCVGTWWMRGGVVDAWEYGFKKNAPSTRSVTGWSRSSGLKQGWSFTWISADCGAMNKWLHLSEPGSLPLHHENKSQ